MDAAGAVYFPGDCHLVPHRLLAELERLVAARGVELRFGVQALGWRTADGAPEALRTSAGELPADDYVLCGGAATPALTRSLGVRLSMQAGKGYSLTLEKPRFSPRVPALFVEARVAVTPMGGALRFGGTMEVAGDDDRVNPARVRGIVKSVPRYYPDFRLEDFAGIAPWRGLRPCSPDGLPYLGRLRRCPRVIVATGHAMMGLSLGPVTGKLVAELVSGETPAIDIALLAPERHG
jgi:D-amino-acid dehydrogenase